MNAAFLLVTTAWFAGDTAAAAPAPPAASACCGTSCCNDDCGRGGHKLLDKLRGMFKRNKDCCDTCAPPKCPAPAPRCEAKCEPTCGSCCEKKKLFHTSHKSCDTCAAAPACDSCGSSSGPKLLDRLRAHFSHDKGCCDSCASGACGGTTVVPRTGEPIQTPPRKMPTPSGKEPPAKEVRIDTPPGQAPAAATLQAAPLAGQPAPAVIPSGEAENLRNPF